ncbi:MAG: DUF1549 domain-containing protein [Planctomycetes bacterium]|nr:DUF1549 domain-containing protein [Planctomycetota bacterium]
MCRLSQWLVLVGLLMSPLGLSGAEPPSVDFELDLQPIFTKFGCNAGACHGKQRGQNGFQLSLLAFDPDFDFDTLTKESRGRRLSPSQPEQSLLLLKPIGAVPHGGGKRLESNGPDFATLRSWVLAGTPRAIPNAPKLERISVDPSDAVLGANNQKPLKVIAHYSNGTTRDVTRLSQFQSNESAIAAVNDSGLISTNTITGESAVMARYMNMIAVCTVSVPLTNEVPKEVYDKLPRKNLIDEQVWQKLARLRLTPSEPAPDHTFLRRVFIDIIGRAPTADEAKQFLDDPSPNKRETLVDHLLAQPDYAEHWANKWADLLRPNPYHVGIKSVLNYDAWIRDAFRKNKPYDQFVRELVSAKGSTWRNGSTNMFRDKRQPEELTTIVSQLFLGIRLECAKCHHHPFEKWAQDDFYSFAAYFGQIGRKGTGISAPISGSEEFIFTGGKARTVLHPQTQKAMEPRPLFGNSPALPPEADPRDVLAAWITSRDNSFFAQVMVNRVWTDLMERGLVEPVDDLRASNPPSNGPLLEALGADFRDNGYDIKKLIRRITTSHVYGLSSVPNDRNSSDTRNYSRHYRQRLRGEVLLDSISQITGTTDTFAASAPGTRAKELWTVRIESLFLDAFGRPDENQDPPCERTSEPTVVQVLHLMNSENLYSKVTTDSGVAAQLAKTELAPTAVVESLYLSIYSRRPSEAESKAAIALFAAEGAVRRQVIEDLMWALLNTPEFVFKD